MASAASIFPEIAGFNPTATMQQGQLRQQQLGLNALQAQRQQAEIPLIQQQTQQAGLQNQLVQQQINDQKAIGAAWAEWDPQQDPSGQGLLKTAVRNGATPQSVMGVQQHLAAYNASLATADKTRLENQKMRDDDYAGKMQAIIDADPTKQEQLWQAHVEDFAKDAPGEQLPPHFTAQDAKTFLNLHQFRSQQIENELKKRQAENEAAGTTEKQAAAAKDIEETRKTKLTNDILQKSQEGGDPTEITGGQHPIAAILQGIPPNDPMVAGLTNMYELGGKMPILENGITRYPMREEAIKTAGNYLKAVQEANSPQIRAGKVATVVGEKTATAPITVATAGAEEGARLRTRAALAPGAVAEIQDPALQQQAIRSREKALDDYNQKEAGSQTLQEFINQVRAGNEQAWAQLPLAQIRQFVKGQINRQELASVGNGVSVGRKLSNWVDEGIQGRPSEETLRDLEALQGVAHQMNRQVYRRSVAGINDSTGAKYSLEPIETPKEAPAAPTSKGKLTDQNIARQYLQRAGGDKEKARQLAKQEGWTF